MAHVLIADDDPDIRELFEMTVGSLGHTWCAVGDGGAAIEALAQPGYDLAILDVGMPCATGIEVVAKVRADDPARSLPIILVSAYSSDDDVRRGLEAGADDYLTKPVVLAELRRRICALLAS